MANLRVWWHVILVGIIVGWDISPRCQEQCLLNKWSTTERWSGGTGQEWQARWRITETNLGGDTPRCEEQNVIDWKGSWRAQIQNGGKRRGISWHGRMRRNLGLMKWRRGPLRHIIRARRERKRSRRSGMHGWRLHATNHMEPDIGRCQLSRSGFRVEATHKHQEKANATSSPSGNTFGTSYKNLKMQALVQHQRDPGGTRLKRHRDTSGTRTSARTSSAAKQQHTETTTDGDSSSPACEATWTRQSTSTWNPKACQNRCTSGQDTSSNCKQQGEGGVEIARFVKRTDDDIAKECLDTLFRALCDVLDQVVRGILLS